MTLNANRNNIKPMFWFIRPMVVFFCLFATGTPIVTCRKQFAVSNSMIDFASGFYLFGIVFVITFVCLFVCLFTFCSLGISLLGLFAFFGLFILPFAVFAINLQTIMAGTVFIKLRQWKDSFAFRTSFGYNWFRHGSFSLSKRLCLEPPESYILSRGLSYYSNSFAGVKQF